MNKTIRILHLEDNPRDAEILRDRLEADNLVCEVVRADSKEQFVEALGHGPFDVVFCDYNLPDYDGISALQLAREKHPATPVLLISGSLGEEEAVKCLQHGATDYLLKQRLDRLPAAVKRALAEAEMRRKRLQTERMLQESEERFRQLAEQSSEGFWFTAIDPPRVLYVSPAIERLWGIPAARFYENSDVWLDATHPEDRPRVQAGWEAFSTGQSARFETEYRVVRPDNSVRCLLASGIPIRDQAGAIVRLSGVVRDITEQKEAKRQILRAQRLESIGQLASGVAHDLNNALAPIMMAAEMIRIEFPESASQYLEIIETSSKRGAEMVKQLTTFAKGADGERSLLQPQRLLKEMEKLIRRTFPKNINVMFSCPGNLPSIVGDGTQLHQVLLNLCVNARDAMPKGGTLTLKGEAVPVDALLASTIGDIRPGRYVLWQVEDTGTGIPPEMIDRIFEPFFSTKGSKGTGLGLSTVAGILKGHGGFVQVCSTKGSGTKFVVYLPVTDAGRHDTALFVREEIAFRGNGEKILVVDDEDALREAARGVLTALNFKVLTAADGTAALLHVAQNATDLRAVLTDMHMPGMDGLSFVRLLKVKAPKAGIILASGGLDESEESELMRLGVNAFLQKPFTHERLVAALNKVFSPDLRADSSPSIGI